MRGKKVLLVDDDVYIREIVKRAFSRVGVEVVSAVDGKEGLRQFFNHRPDLVILDIMMPNLDGWETCRQIRMMSDVPVIMLTSLRGDEEIIRGLDCGADDFVSKPFKADVLLARSRAVLRRVKSTVEDAQSYRDDYLVVDLEAQQVLVNGELVDLTPTENRLLAYLVRHAGRIRTFGQILENVWGPEYLDAPNYVHVYISHLRQKIEEDSKNPRYIVSEHGEGYRFQKKA